MIKEETFTKLNFYQERTLAKLSRISFRSEVAVWFLDFSLILRAYDENQIILRSEVAVWSRVYNENQIVSENQIEKKLKILRSK